MRKVARYCGIKLQSFSVMGNHYHQVIKVPAKIRLTDSHLMKRVAEYYGYGSQEHKQLQRALKDKSMKSIQARRRFLRMMGNLSTFQKLLKQRFSIWYNDKHDRRGTLWMERFKSTLVENSPYARMCVSAYVELNPVRAGIVNDPKEYPFCSYSMALAGDREARAGICAVTGFHQWAKASAAYRIFMIREGVKSGRGRHRVSRELLMKTLEAEGRLPVADLLRLRLRFFSDGLAVGCEGFLKKVVAGVRNGLPSNRLDDLQALPGGDWKSLKALQRFRNPVIS